MIVAWLFLIVVFFGSLLAVISLIDGPTVIHQAGAGIWLGVAILCVIAATLLHIRAAIGRWERGEKLQPNPPDENWRAIKAAQRDLQAAPSRKTVGGLIRDIWKACPSDEPPRRHIPPPPPPPVKPPPVDYSTPQYR